MQGKSHLAIGITTAAWFAYALPLPDNGSRVMVAVVAAAGSLAPDLDHLDGKASHSFADGRTLSRFVRAFGGHRTWTHDLRVGPPVFGVVTAVAAWFLHGPIHDSWWAFGLAMAVGCLAHIYADARTVSGVPFGRHRIRIGRTFVTGSDAELLRYRLLYRPLSWASVVAALWLVAS